MKQLKHNLFSEAVNQIISNKMLRSLAVKQLDKQLHKSVFEDPLLQFEEEKLDRYHFLTSLMMQARKNLDRGYLKKDVVRKMVKVFVGDTWKPNRVDSLNEVKIAYQQKYGEYPPRFIVLSPEKACNLNCEGCYASCKPGRATHLDYDTSYRIVKEAHDIFGSRFIVISGGEPFMYHSQGKSILDIFEAFSDTFFLVYTNGTFFDKKTSARMAELGNVTPAISVEGFEPETDERRGKGIHKKIVNSMTNLREVGVPFGVSVTATSKNFDILMTDEFYKYYFETMGATYMWQFQLMPIGRGKEVMNLMVNPEQRMALYNQWKRVITELKYPFADFWNSATLSNGCIAYGRWNGYFYIDWEGRVMPCVFVPYYHEKITDVFARGGNIADAIQSPTFKNGRKWQKDYGFDSEDHQDNVLMPCSIRDHYRNFYDNILADGVKGAGVEAEEAIHDQHYIDHMTAYGEQLEALTAEIFDEKFLRSLSLEKV